MKTLSSRLIATAALVAGLAGTSSVMAASTWVFSGVDGGAANTTYTGNPTSAPDLTISGVKATNGTGDAGFASGATWSSQSLVYWGGSGLGMYSGADSGSPNHALDNNGTTEAVLLSFASSVTLTSIGIGWNGGNDTDVSVFRYTGAGTPTVAGGTAANLLSSGWSLVGNYGDLGTDNTEPYSLVNSTGLGSSWWLISAYNTTYGSTSANGGALGQGNDYFKLFAVAGDKCTNTTVGGCGSNRVPEPGSLALLGIGLVGLVGTYRRRAGALKASA